MIKALKKLADIDLKRKISSLQSQYNDEEFSIEELEQLIDTSFQKFSNDFNALAITHNLDIKLIQRPTNELKFTIIENEKELYGKSQIDSTHALREEEYIKLFVSYSRTDKEDVELFISKLEQTPYPFVFWKDDRNLLSGEDFKGNIQEAIEECDFGLLMVSENFESEFIVEHELPHFLEMRNSEISKTKASIPLFINNKNNAINKLNYINDEMLIFSYYNRGFIESHDREEFIEGLISEIFNKFNRKKEKQKDILLKLFNSEEIKELNQEFITTKADNNIDVVQEIKEWSKEKNKQRYFALLGASGMGKTWSCMRIALELLKEENNYLKPIYLDLRHFASTHAIENDFEWKKIIEIVIKGSLANFKQVHINIIFEIIYSGQAFVIFDGLDEVTVQLKNDNQSNAFIGELRKIALVHNKNKILFSCRTQYFKSIQEQFLMLTGFSSKGTKTNDFKSLELIPFTWSQIEQYCEKREIDFKIFKKTITSIHNLEEMSQRPHSLKIISLQLRQLENLRNSGIAINSSDIYLNIIEESLNRDIGKQSLSRTHKPLIMRELSAYMWKKELKKLEYHKLEEWFSLWLYEHPFIADEYQSTNREKLKSDLRSATFLVRPNSNFFTFSHTSMQEFFLAWYLFEGLENGDIHRFDIKIPSIETIEFFVMLWKRENSKKNIEKSFNIMILEYPLFAFEIYLIAYRLKLIINIENGFHLKKLDLSQKSIIGNKYNQINLKNSTFNKVKFKRTELKYIDFSNTEFINCIIIDSTWQNINLSNSKIKKCSIKTWLLKKSNLLNSNFYKTKIDYSKLLLCSFDEKHKHYFSSITNEYVKKNNLKSLLSISHNERITDIVFSYDEKFMVSHAEDGSTILYNLKNLEIIKTFYERKRGFREITFNYNSQYFITYNSADISLYSLKTLQLIKKINCNDRIKNIAFVIDFQLMTIFTSDKVLIYNLNELKFIESLNNEEYYFENIGFKDFKPINFNSTLIKDSRFYELFKNSEAHEIIKYKGSNKKNINYKLYELIYSNNNLKKMTLIQFDKYLYMDDYHGDHIAMCHGKNINVNPFMNYKITPIYSTLDISNDFTPINNNIGFFEKKASTPFKSFNLTTSWIFQISFSRNGKFLASASSRGLIFLYDLKKLKLIKCFKYNKEDWVKNVTFSHDSKFMATALCSDNIHIYDLKSLALINIIEGDDASYGNIEFSNNGKFLVTTSSNKSISLYSTSDFQLITIFNDHKEEVMDVTFSSDSTLIASTSPDKTVNIYNVEDLKLIKSFEYKNQLGSVAINPNNTYIAFGSSDSSVQICDIESGKYIKSLNNHSNEVWDVVFSHDNKFLASSSHDCNVNLYEVGTFKSMSPKHLTIRKN